MDNEKIVENKSGDNSLRDWFGKSRSSDGKPGWVQLGGKYAGKPCAKQPGQTTKPKCGSSKMKRNLNKKEEDAAFRRKNAKDPNPDRKGKAINVKTESTQIQEGEKDACYKKVKSRYSVWPSAYASGALVKCRKVGAKNWGNKSKKEEFEGLKTFSEFQAECWKTHKKVGMKMKGGKLVNDCRPKNEEAELDEGSRLDGPEERKKDLNKRYDPKGGGTNPFQYKPDKKVKEEAEVYWSSEALDDLENLQKEAKVDKGRSDYGKASIRNYRRSGPGHDDPGMFDPEGKRGKTIEKRREEHKARRGVKGAKVPAYNREETSFEEAKKCWKGYEKKGSQTLFGKTYNRCVKKEETTNVEEGAAWTKKSGQNKEGGLNEKERKSYEKENPGSDLKAPSKKVGNPRRASFCARMKGMRKRQKPSNNTGEDRLSKSLRAWNC